MERKLATVLFVDLVGSTQLVSGSDPEVARRRVTRFFERAAHCIEVHGGTVEKFAGDAVMAAFGIPQAHEDDAERAVRAALAIRDSMSELGLEARIGVEAGHVVTELGASTFATGEAVNLAARLQQAAEPGEILIGPGAHRLTRGRLRLEELGPLTLRGRQQPLWTWRVLAAEHRADGGARRQGEARFVGRDDELDLLESTFARAVRGRRAHLFTIYGEPGVGKSRLARELAASLEGATILSGRCLPYGEGVTYWPLAEMVKAAAGIADDDPLGEAEAKLRECCEDEAVADLLALAAGVLDALEAERSRQGIAWAAREWAEQLAAEQPLVLVFEDIHWAEEPLLELVEHLAERVREAPLLILCLARPELLDVRPGWGGGRVRATSIELEPLQPEASEELLEALLEQSALPGVLGPALLEKTEGNPLFLEETIRMLADADADGAALDGIPDTLQALIAARVDLLPPDEKALLQRAAVIGRFFWGGALAHLAPELACADSSLDNLVLRDFVLREQRSTITGERAYKFKHVLIREVAYAGLAKSARAAHHARFAEWLRERAGDELLEIRAYHLDQAATLHAELDGEPPAQLAADAAAALEAAGRRALAREANRAGRRLALRALELEPTLDRRYLAARAAWRLDDLPAVAREMERVLGEARAAGARTVEGKALTALADVKLLRDADLPRARELAEEALDALADAPPVSRYDALRVLSQIAYWGGDLALDERYVREGLEIAHDAGRKDLEAVATHALANVYFARFEHERAAPLVARALELADESGSIVARAAAKHVCARLHRARGERADGEAALEEARELFAEAGAVWMVGRTLNALAEAAGERGDLGRAERLLREAVRLLGRVEDRGALCESERRLAQVLVQQGKLEEAEGLALEARATVGPNDVASTATTAMALGVVRAAQGRDAEAEALLHEALAGIERTGFRNVEAEVLSPLAQFFEARGRAGEAERCRERLDALRAGASVEASTARIV